MIPRRNKNKIPRMPGDWELIACTFGVGRDDYLFVALAYKPHPENLGPYADEFVTWNGNAEAAGDATGVGEGHYMPRQDKDEREWVEAAWADFSERSRKLFGQTPQWFEWERENAPRATT